MKQEKWEDRYKNSRTNFFLNQVIRKIKILENNKISKYPRS